MFTPHKGDHSGAMPWEYIPAAAGTYQAGQLLNVASGKLAKITAATKTTPPYLCMADITVADGGNVPVVRVSNDRIFETTLSAEAAGAAIGTKLEVTAGGMEADAAAAGTFEVVSLSGTAAGSTVYGRFA